MADIEGALPLVVLTEQFARLPGIGQKTAARLAYAVLDMPQEQAREFADAILTAKREIHECPICCNLTEREYCPVCENPRRDQSTVCVVESAKDAAAIERLHEFSGVYHVLHGLLSPLRGVMPEDLRIEQLLERVKSGKIEEIIMALDTSVEGEATAVHIARACEGLPVKVTRLGLGLPVGASIEYTDAVTLRGAIENRSPVL